MSDLPKTLKTRKEIFLNAIATGQQGDLPTPVTREEIYLKYIAEHGGGGTIGRSVTNIYKNESASENPETVTLTVPYTDFDELYLTAKNNTGEILTEESYLTNGLKAEDQLRLLVTAQNRIVYKITDSTTLTLIAQAGTNFIDSIYGIKYDSNYITIDTEMSSTSTNPVQNKTIKEYVDNAIAAITDYESEVFPNA